MTEILFAFDPVVLAAFIGAGLLLNLTPGADFVFISASGIQGGARVGMAAALGVNLGVVVHVVSAAAGLSALLLANPAAYDGIRYVGAAYLLYLAWRAWFDSGLATENTQEGKAAVRLGPAIRRGFVTNVLNPKTALFIFAFIPQFTDPAIGPVWAQILLLGGIFLINGLLFALTLGALSGALGDALRPHVRVLSRLTSILFVGLAARLIAD